MRPERKLKFKPKAEFVERMEKLIGKSDAEKFFEISYIDTPSSIRCNTLKISPERLKEKLTEKGWKIKQPFEKFPEVMIVEGDLLPGELGNAKEHLLGYYYVQEISSMLPLIALKPEAGELFLDLCASPGSKTTQAAAMMENRGVIIANDKDFRRLNVLISNLEKCGVMNAVVVQHDGANLCKTLNRRLGFKFDKILVDAPCSGEGTLRKSLRTYDMWNKKVIEKFSRTQKKLIDGAIELLKIGGEMIYSTCTLAPEENEEVVNYILENFDVEIEKLDLPLKTREGICEWEGESYDGNLSKACRVYPQDNNTDGFFLAKVKKLGEKNEFSNTGQN
jgi:tRNA (cytosine49-C5)-methyltransferase